MSSESSADALDTNVDTAYIRDSIMKVSKWGNSLAIRISAPLAHRARIAEGTEVEVTAASGRIVVTPARREYRLEDLVSAITAENRHAETQWGGPVGHETW